MAVRYTLAVCALPPGNGTTDATTGQQRVTGSGRAEVFSQLLTNESGAPITHFKVALLGWMVTKAGVTDCGNDVPVTGYIEYGDNRTNFSGVAINAVDSETGEVELPEAIPAGASFNFALVAVVEPGQYRFTNNGFAGLMTKADTDVLRKERLFCIGDGFMNGADARMVGYTAAQGKCPAIQMAVNNSRPYTYTVDFDRFIALAQRLGITRFVSNWGASGFGFDQTWDNILLDLYKLRDQARAASIKFTQCTMLPVTDLMTVKAVSVQTTPIDNELLIEVADTSLFDVNTMVSIQGAVQAEFNVSSIVHQVVDATHFKVLFPGGATVQQATGSIILQSPGWRSSKLTIPFLPNFSAGSTSSRAKFNSVARSKFDDYVEWADVVERRRDSGYWASQGEDPYQDNVSLITVVDSTVLSKTQFHSTYDAPVDSTGGGVGRLFGITGANKGISRVLINNYAGGLIKTSELPFLPAVGDTFKIMATGASPTADGRHPANGAQNAIIESFRNTLDVWLAR